MVLAFFDLSHIFDFEVSNPSNSGTSYKRVKKVTKMAFFPLFEVHRHKKYSKLVLRPSIILILTKNGHLISVRVAKIKVEKQ